MTDANQTKPGSTGDGTDGGGDGLPRTIAVIGAGTVGSSWTALFMAHGLDVVATDPEPGAHEALVAFVERVMPDLRALGARGQGKLSFLDDAMEAAQWSDFIQECTPEVEASKAELLGRLDEAAAADVIISSSTSMIPRSRLVAKCRRPARVIVGHPFNPPHLVPLVEIVGSSPDADAVTRARAFYTSVGREPVVLRREVYGHIGNRLQAAILREAFSLLENDIADVEDIDRAVRFGPGLRWAIMGPFLTYHLSGGKGGVRHSFEHFGPGLGKLWSQLGTPAMRDSLKQIVIHGVERMSDGRSIATLEADRDQSLRALLSLRTPANDE